jgi:dUTP pyrophosphatase
MIQFVKTDLADIIESYGNINFAPKRADTGSSGYDLRACIPQPLSIYPDQVVKIPTGVKVWIGSDDILPHAKLEDEVLFAGLLLPRSSSKGLILNNTIGLIDNSYQGEIFCKFRNITNDIITIEVGEAFAQLIIIPTWVGKMKQVTGFAIPTARGEGGFGSTNRVGEH